MQTRVTDQPAFLLHRREWQNTSLILDVFTLEYGRINLIAKGARNSKTKSLFQPFSILTISWTGQQNLKLLVGIDGSQTAIKESNYLSLLYINELLNLLLPLQEPNVEIFNHYLQLLNRAELEIDESCLREFELNILQLLGYFPDIDIDADQGLPIESDSYYHFEINRGFIRCPKHDLNSIKGKVIIDWKLKCYSGDNVMRLAKSVLRSTIDFNLHGKRLKSRDVYKQIRGVK